ncbi:carbohydrate kinase family protein [Streptosporangium canum]|uniref:carbohydrate kinase family protein n=1 Tax=Streptosporangium canum TaxID=324952 RepID=UPI0037AD69A2
MTTTPPAAAVNCFSYLASVHTLHVPYYPPINYGVDVTRTEDLLAGDGPLVAAFLTALGHTATLYSNPVSDDAPGRAITARLHGWGVKLAPITVTADRTRVNTVVCDERGNRTWFSGLGGVADELTAIDPDAVAGAPLVYLDCYEVLHQAPGRILNAALAAGAEVVLNLGGSPPPSWLAKTLDGRRIAIVQTNADENDPARPGQILQQLRELGVADIAVVTAGRQGAIAAARDGQPVRSAALPVTVQQVQGTGSAFSAAFIHQHLAGTPLKQALRFACTAASLWCGRTAEAPLMGEADIYAHLEALPR